MSIGVEITVEQEGEIYIVTIEGRIDATTTPTVEKRLAKLIETANKVLVDFSNVTYLSSAGMRLLLSMSKKLKAKEGEVGFFSLTDDVMEIIRMAGFERILRIFSTRKEAVRAFQK